MMDDRETTRLTGEERELLLRIARDAIATTIGRTVPSTEAAPEALRQPAGAFVTLTIGGELRGCIGTLDASRPLHDSVADSARSAATRDPRFAPLSEDELDEVRIEISVLGEFHPVTDAREIEIGRDGLLLRMAGHSGLLLPQVPVEHGWNVATFLERLCTKAGVPQGSWRRPECRLERFTAEVFGES